MELNADCMIEDVCANGENVLGRNILDVQLLVICAGYHPVYWPIR